MIGLVRVAIPALVSLVALPAASAEPHRVEGFLSSSGIEFVEDELANLLPDEIFVPEVSGSFSCLEASQRDTTVAVELHDLSIDTPNSGTILVETEFSVESIGDLTVNGCDLSSTTCRNELSVERGVAEVEFEFDVEGGEPRLEVHDVNLDIPAEDTHIELSGCSLGDAASTVIDAVKVLAFDIVVDFVGTFAASQVAPMVEDILLGLSDLEGRIGPLGLSFEFQDASAGRHGVSAAVGVDLQSHLQEPGGCVADDAPAPQTHAAPPPDLTLGEESHAAVAVNLGLIDAVLYNAWRVGLMCLTDLHLEVLGVPFDVDRDVGRLLPGFPPGTDFGLEIRVTEPPRVEADESEGARVTVVATGVEADLIGRHADGTDVVHIEADVRATAEVDLDPGARALFLRAGEVEIDRLEVDDEVRGESLGIDEGRLAHAVEEAVAPGLIEELGDIPLTGSIVGFSGYYVLLRDVFSTEGHIGAKLDLFAAPEDDDTLPSTSIASQSAGPAAAGKPAFRMMGSDPVTPEELLRYRVVVDGEEREPTFQPDVILGERGVTDTYEVEVSAVDISGNEDPDPIRRHVQVDGVPPDVHIDGGGAQSVSGGSIELSWSQSDDLTGPAGLEPRVELYRVGSPDDLLDVDLVYERDLASGVTAHELSLEPGELYRADVIVRDEAGNEGVASARLRTSSGGCAGAGAGAGGAAGAALVLVAFALLRRPRRAADA